MKKSAAIFLTTLSCFLYAKQLPTEGNTCLEANAAFFDGEKIDLLGQIKVSNNAYVIFADQAILTRDSEKKSALEFPWAELKGTIKATFYEKYVLECDQVNLDYVARTLIFSGQKPILFHDTTRKLFADHAVVEFMENRGDFEVAKIKLQGNVYMMSLPTTAQAQYAVADRVEYYPKEERALFFAEGEKRVLFCDKEKQLEISAQEVHAEKREKKDFIEGIGDVRFTFKEEEFDKLKEKFHWYKE